MLIMSLTTLVANAFIELNKESDVRKIELNNIFIFDNKIKNVCNEYNIDYISQLSSVYFYELKFNYHIFFDVHEEENGYIVKLKDNITYENLLQTFRINDNKLLTLVLEQINIYEIIGKNVLVR